MSVSELTDAELAEELRARGVNPGPITATTRRVYEKKLLKLQKEEGVATEPVTETSQYEEVPDDEENSPPPKPRTPTKRTTRSKKVEPLYMEETTVRQRPALRSEPKPAPPPEPKKPAAKKSGGGVPFWIKLLLLLFVVFFAYLVYINMEPSSESKVPKSINSEGGSG